MECKIDLVQLICKEGLPLYVYADGTVTHKMVPGKIKIGKIWGCLDGVEPKEMLPCKEQFFSRPFTEEDARKQAEEVIATEAADLEEDVSEVKVGWYWSSSEYSYNYAWLVNASYGGVDDDVKAWAGNYVRCVLAF